MPLHAFAHARQQLTFKALRMLAAAQREPLPLERLGSDYGGWLVPTRLISPSWIVYSVGVGEDVTFDLELIRRCGCEVHAFDPTPRAARHVAAHPGIPSGFHFHPFGLWKDDGEVRFYAPKDPAHVSHSITNLQHTSEYFVGAVKTVRSAMAESGHDRIDLLKLDIEGAEYAVIREMLASGVTPKLICVELESPAPLTNAMLLVRLLLNRYRVLRVDGRNVTLARSDVVDEGRAES